MALSPQNIFTMGISVSQPVFMGRRILNAYRMTKYNLYAKTFIHERTVEETGFAALSLYWGYVGFLKSLDAMSETCRWFENLVNDQKKMVDKGLIIELDLLNSRIQLDNFRLSERRMLDASLNIAGQLLLFLGLAIDATVEIDTSGLHIPATAFVVPNNDSLEKRIGVRADIKAASYQLEMLRLLSKIQKASYAPSIVGVANLGYSNQYATKEGELKKNSSFTVSMNWPLFDWGKALRETQQTGYQIKTLQMQINNLCGQVKLKILELARKVEASIIACDISLQDVEIARKALEIAQKKYDVQSITNTELLTARNQLTNKVLLYTQMRIAMILAFEEYKIAPLSTGAE
jgi:outer membrane protein TolC